MGVIFTFSLSESEDLGCHALLPARHPSVGSTVSLFLASEPLLLAEIRVADGNLVSLLPFLLAKLF